MDDKSSITGVSTNKVGGHYLLWWHVENDHFVNDSPQLSKTGLMKTKYVSKRTEY